MCQIFSIELLQISVDHGEKYRHPELLPFGVQIISCQASLGWEIDLIVGIILKRGFVLYERLKYFKEYVEDQDVFLHISV